MDVAIALFDRVTALDAVALCRRVEARVDAGPSTANVRDATP